MIKDTSVPYARLQFRPGESQEDYAKRANTRPALFQAYIAKVLFYALLILLAVHAANSVT